LTKEIVVVSTIMIDRMPEGDRCFELLAACRLFRSYQDAFKAATGLPLVLIRRKGSHISDKVQIDHGNAFCQILRSNGTCDACAEVLADMRKKAVNGTYSTMCFAGMKETAVPINHAGKSVAFLKTGEILMEESSEERFMHIAGLLAAEGKSVKEIKRLRKAYMGSPVMERNQYEGVVFMLGFFSKQLSEHLSELLKGESEQVPAPVRKALSFIENHLDERLNLEAAAAYSGLSTSQFCKVFKETINATFTEYVNRRRIEWARRELLRPGSRVTEVAYRVGFASLSQFNRSFNRYTGEAPRDYRRRCLLEVA